jgi:alkaline phosphatase
MKSVWKKLTLVAVLLWSAVVIAGGVPQVKYVFLFIGDGLSFPQRMMADEFSRITRGKRLNINTMPVQTATTTYCADSFITDSAASGTAIATGTKTNSRWLGVAPDGTKLESIAAVAKRNGRKVGIITSVTINHATPGAFYAHQKSRSNYYNIGLELIESGFDYFGGGGVAKNKGKKDKDTDIYELAAKAGMQVLRTKEAVRNAKVGTGRILASPYNGNLPYVLDREKDDLKLADFVRQGIAHCDNPAGFFIMVEGGAIDWCCHANDASGALNEILDLDDAVAVALEFYRKHPQETLIVVTGDHETGGMTLGFAGTGYKSYLKLLSNQNCSYVMMSKAFDQLAESGKPVSWEDAAKMVTKVSGLIFPAKPGKAKAGTLVLSAAEVNRFKAAFMKDFPNGKRRAKSNELCRLTLTTLNNKAGIGWTTGAHTALPVGTTGIGKNSAMVMNMRDNTDIAKLLKQMVGK